MTRKNDWPEVPGMAAVRRQEAEDKRALDEIERLTTPPLSDKDQLALEEAERVEQSWRRRKGLDAPYSVLRSSTEIAREGRAAHWPGHLRAQYLAAIEDERIAGKATRSYGGRS